MLKCTHCGKRAEPGRYICEFCGKELPDPTEMAQQAEEPEAPRAAVREEPAAASSLFGSALDVKQATGAVPPEQLTVLAGAEVMLEDGLLEPATVYLAKGRVAAVSPGKAADQRDGSTYHDLSGMVLSPGFMDVHIHGMMGIDTNTAGAADFQRISVAAAQRGITSLTLTTVACSAGELSTVLTNLREAKQQGVAGARLLGLHLESNFISPQFKGAQPPENIFAPDDERGWQVREVLDEFADEIRIVTLAPEVPGVVELIPWLRERNIVASIGHSAATYEQALDAIDAGANHATHLFNAMPPLHHRNPGIVGACLECDEVFVEMVCDGVHIHPAVVSTVISAKGAERFIPVSDALQGAGMTEGEFALGGQHVTVRDGVARLDNGTIAGSITTMDRILNFLVNTVGWDLGEALFMVATTPALGLGLTEIGRIAPQSRGDLVVLDQDLQVAKTFVEGQLVYQRG